MSTLIEKGIWTVFFLVTIGWWTLCGTVLVLAIRWLWRAGAGS